MDQDQLWVCLDIQVSQQEYESAVALLLDLNTSGFQEFAGARHIRLRAYFAPDQLEAQLESRIQAVLGRHRGAMEYHLTRIRFDPLAWLEEYRTHFVGFPVGETFFIHPGWESAPACYPISLMIEPGAAFGTGTHESTRLALQQLEELTAPVSTILDIGTGSGILAIAAAKMHPEARVIAIDVDSQATQTARENFQKNGTPGIHLACGSPECLDVHSDALLANLTRTILKQECSLLSRLAGKDLIVSGFTGEQAREVVELFVREGFALENTLGEGGWSSLLLTRVKPLRSDSC